MAAEIAAMKEAAAIGRIMDANKAAFIAANQDLTDEQLLFVDRELRRITPQLGREGAINCYVLFGEVRASTQGAALQTQVEAFELACSQAALQMAIQDTQR